jgi:predicted DNA-binding protein
MAHVQNHKQLHVWVPASVHDRLVELAKTKKQPKTMLVRAAILRAVEAAS